MYKNLSFYKFQKIESLSELRELFLNKCKSLELRGSVLLAHEGINCNVSGLPEKIDQYKKFLLEETPFQNLPFKESFSENHSFKRMLVKLKKEIIPMGIPDIDPEHAPAPFVTPKELKRWLDENRDDVVLLDTRNSYEAEQGTFKNALVMPIRHFRKFSEHVQELPESLREQLKKKTVVTFCTGGIRCEKAAPLLQKLGFEKVYQLEGGILKYFEECGGSHYLGNCYVFDKRENLAPNLKPVPTVGIRR